MEEKALNTSSILQARRKRRNRRIRLSVVLCLLLAALLFWLTGMAGSSFTAVSDILESIQMIMLPGEGFPAKMDATNFISVQPISGGIAVLGEKDTVVYTSSGSVLQSFAHGYGQPGLTAGGTRLCVYNRGGTDLKIASRMKELGSKTFDFPIYFAFMAENGTLGVVTQSESHKAELTVLSTGFDQLYQWRSAADYPVRAAFAPNGRDLAVACLSPDKGLLSGMIYLLNIGSEEEKGRLQRSGSVPMELFWLDGRQLLVLYQDAAVLYDTGSGEEAAAYTYPAPLVAVSHEGKNTAFLFGEESKAAALQLTILDDRLQVLGEASPGVTASGVLLTRDRVYLQGADAVLFYTLQGEKAGEQALTGHPLALVESGRVLAVTAQQLLALDDS